MYVPRGDRALHQYFEEIARIDLLSKRQECDLARRIRQGDKEAIGLLTRANLRFVVSVAKRYQRQGLALADLISAGNLGLLKAAERFDETRGFKFISYAVWWIKQGIQEALAKHSRLVRLPLNCITATHKVTRARATLHQRLQREPSRVEVAVSLDIDVARVADALHAGAVSMDAPFEGKEGRRLLDILPCDNDAPDQGLLEESVSMSLQRALDLLTPREAEILRLYFGIGRGHPHTLEQIGRRVGLTRERVRQIKHKALRHLRLLYCSEVGNAE